jgi:hypothetical protein
MGSRSRTAHPIPAIVIQMPRTKSRFLGVSARVKAVHLRALRKGRWSQAFTMVFRIP